MRIRERGVPSIYLLILLGAISALGWSTRASAACGASTITWSGGQNTAWATTNNWVGANVPDTSSENALIVSAARIPALATATVGCLEIQSGLLNATSNGTSLTIAGDYFRATSSGMLAFTSGRTITLIMAGTTTQTLEVVDPVNYVTVSNNGTVTFTQPFTLRNTLSITGVSTSLNIDANLNLSDAATAFTIPSGTTVNVGSGVTLTAAGGITVNGTLTVASGGQILLGSGKTLSVGSGGALQLNGSSGNPASIDSVSGTYTFNVVGSLSANYFSISHMGTAGVNVTGAVSQLQNGDFRYVASAGVAMTVGAAASLPSTMVSVGFYDDSAFGNNFNFVVNGSYAGNTVYLDYYAGGLGGAAKESTDTGNKITWGSQATTRLTVSDATAGGVPGVNIAPSSAATLFGTYSFSLNQTDPVSTDVTSVKFTLNGTAVSSDIAYIQVFKDAASSKNCAYNAGVDTQVGSNLTLSGSPASATATFAAADLTTDGSTAACVHVLVATSATAQAGRTVGISIESTTDVANSRLGGGSYSFGDTSAPPVRPGSSTITGTQNVWDGSTSTVWTNINNWTPKTVPTSTQDCVVGSGTNVPALTANQPCRNTTLQTGGTLNFSSGTWQLQTYGALSFPSGYTFQNATTGVLAMVGSTSQSISGGTTFPGTLLINNSGGADVTIDANTTITGDVTVTAGNLRVVNGKTLTVGGNITVQTGATLTVEPGGILTMADAKTLTVNSGGTLALLGNASNTALVNLSSGASGYSIVVNGTIKAQYYTIDHMGLAGLTINAGATIDATYHLQNGSFTYPVVNNAVMLTLNRQVPGNSITNMAFDANGSAVTGVTNIKTNTTAGILAVTTYSGTWSGYEYENAPTYLLSWTGATTTIDVTQEATSPTNVYQGVTYTMGRFGFKQTQAGASFLDTDITSLTLTLTGTGSSSDISAVRIYYDASCAGSGGTQLGSAGTFSGNPATVTFSGISATVQASTTSPPKRCIYVQYDIASSAVNAKTVGVKLNTNGHITNSQGYGVAAGTPLPVTLGTSSTIIGSSTTWLGSTSTDFCTAGNWSAGLPSSSLNCMISSASNNPLINGTSCTVGTCKSVTINSGSLTINASGKLKLYGSLTNNATFTNSGTLELNDGGVAVNQVLTGASSLGVVTFVKTGGGTARASGTSTITTLTIPSGSVFDWQVQSGDVLTLTNGLSITPSGAVFDLQGGGTLKIPSTQSISVAGGTFKISGTNSSYPNQTSATSGKVTNNGSGRYSFNATSGTVNLTGWWIDNIDANGLVIGGTTTLSSLNGGQFTNLPTTYPVKTIQLNTSGTIPATASNVGWNWGSSLNSWPYTGVPGTLDNYLLASSTGCGNQTISFDQWFGDFFDALDRPTTTTEKISSTNCSITIAASASPVSLVSLTATPYNDAISLDWETGSELDHRGFNVYRSLDPTVGFVQVNSSLIRNLYSSAALHGVYRYADADVANGLTYYYRIEDVASSGARTMHGPVWATPGGTDTIAGSPAGTNTGDLGNGADTGTVPVSGGPIATPDVIDLGNGVHLLAQTQSSLRLEIVPPAASYAASSWDASYVKVTVPGYSSTLEAGHPELVERTILVEVDDSKTTATLTQASVTEATPGSYLIAPAPSYALSGSTLVASYNPDATAYALGSDAPAAFHALEPTLKKIGGKTFVAVTVTPLLYNAATRAVRRATRIVLDIGLDGSAWISPVPTGIAALSPSAVEGALRIRYQKSGMYEVSYDDLAAANLEGFVSGASVASLRLYVRGQETPLETVAAGATFASGDKLRFFLPYLKTVDDTENEAVLSTVALAGSVNAPLRMRHIDGDPTGASLSNEQGTYARVTAEQDLFYIQDVPLGVDGADHFYWSRITQDQGAATQASATFQTSVELPGLLQGASDPVLINLTGRGRGALAVNPIHHLAIWVNDVPFVVADSLVVTQGPTSVAFRVPALYFAPGVNRINVRVLGDMVPTGDTDIFDIDAIEVNYRAERVASAGVLELFSYRPGQATTVDGFASAAFSIYDVTEPSDVVIVDGAQPWSSDGLFGATFVANTDVNDDRGYRYFAVHDAAYLKPTALRLGAGYGLPLRSTLQGADLLIVGPRALVDAADELVEQRRSEGLRVVAVSLEQVYAEFSDGVKSSSAIQDLVRYAVAEWQPPAPKYLLLLGDATYDPRKRLSMSSTASSSAMPVYLESGIYADFAADNWFVERDDGTHVPALAVGRIPAVDVAEVTGFVRKLLAYERGDRAPTTANLGKVALVADDSQYGEGFAAMAEGLGTAVRSLKNGSSTQLISRPAYSTDAATQSASNAATQSAILASFTDAPLGIAYIGHGAEDMWADAAVFTATEARGLSNSKLPFVMAYNCLNSYFYDADPTYRGLGETLVLNPDGGAIAFWGSTSLTTPAVQNRLALEFFAQLGQETNLVPHVARYGDLLLRAKVALGSNASTRDTLRSYTLIGDPSTKLPLAAFTGVAPATSQAPSASGGSSEDSDGGFFSCGTIKGPRGGSGGGPSSGALAEFGLLVLLVLGARKFARAHSPLTH